MDCCLFGHQVICYPCVDQCIDQWRFSGGNHFSSSELFCLGKLVAILDQHVRVFALIHKQVQGLGDWNKILLSEVTCNARYKC